jgi:hypothetical protein
MELESQKSSFKRGNYAQAPNKLYLRTSVKGDPADPGYPGSPLGIIELAPLELEVD